MTLCIDSMIFFETENDETIEEAVNRFQRLISDLGLDMLVTSVKYETEATEECETESTTEIPQPEEQCQKDRSD